MLIEQTLERREGPHLGYPHGLRCIGRDPTVSAP